MPCVAVGDTGRKDFEIVNQSLLTSGLGILGGGMKLTCKLFAGSQTERGFNASSCLAAFAAAKAFGLNGGFALGRDRDFNDFGHQVFSRSRIFR